MADSTFGWIIHSTARENARIERLYEDNRTFIDLVKGHFTHLWIDDHFQKLHSPVLESWTTLTYLAALYPQFTYGSLVLSQSFRNPALLAKMMGTLQFLTGGRYIAGIGAGWQKEEYLAYGYQFYPNRVRLQQLEEAILIMKTMWTESPANFKGEYYSIENAECEPLPDPAPQLLIGGGGEQVTLRLVAKYADWMNVTFADLETYTRKLEVLRKYCAEIGRDYSSITKSLWAYVYLTKDGEPPAPDHANRYQIYGTPQQVVEIFSRFKAVGAQHFMLRFVDFPSTQGAELFLDQVLPKL